MANFWKQSRIPHKGWVLLDVIDVREDGRSEDETIYEECMMCGNEKIRYVHIVEHSDISEEFRVGCNCAEKMTEDYINPEKRERMLRNRSVRLVSWINRQWKSSKSGNYYLKIDEHFLLIFRDKQSGKFKYKIDDDFYKKSFDTFEEIKLAIFKSIERLKEHDEW